MHFSLATILAASAILVPPALAAPLPNDGGTGRNAAESCSSDSGSVISVGVGVGVGNSIYHPSSGNNVKVRQGDQGSCPSGWTRSLLQVDLCIEVGGNDHQKEKQQWRPDPTRHAVHAASPYWGAKASSTSTAHRSTHTSAPQKEQDEWTPRGGNVDKHALSRSSSSSSTTRTNARKTTSSAPSATSTGCPQGQTLGTGSFADVCLEIDSSPLFVGGGIKIGGGRDNGPSTTSTKGRSTPRTSAAVPTRSPSDSTSCSDGTSYDSFLGICIDLDTDPLYLGGGIKLGGSPQSQPQRPSSSSSTRNGSPTPRPGSTRPEAQHTAADKQAPGDDLPECNGSNDPRALLDLCVNAGNLLGAHIKLGGSNPSSPSASVSAGPPRSSSSPSYTPNKGNNGDRNNADSNVSNSGQKAHNEGDGSLPPCSSAEDPNAVLGLCAQVGDLLGARVKVGGSPDPSSAPTSQTSGRSPSTSRSSPVLESDGNDGDILDLSLGNLLNAKIGSGPRQDSGPSSTSSRDTNAPTTTPRKVKQTAPIVSYPDVNYDSSSPESKPKNKSNDDQKSRDRDGSGDDDEDMPLLKADVSAAVQVGSSPTAKHAEAQQTSTRARSPQATKKACPVGQILHLGICIEADVDVPGVAHATAAATVAV
ncbi:hypothetical protein JCM16303_006520 [Sporobolomyces ruberrimus]